MSRLLIGAYQLYADGNVDPLNPALPRLPMDGGRELINNRYTIDAKADGTASPLGSSAVRVRLICLRSEHYR